MHALSRRCLAASRGHITINHPNSIIDGVKLAHLHVIAIADRDSVVVADWYAVKQSYNDAVVVSN